MGSLAGLLLIEEKRRFGKFMECWVPPFLDNLGVSNMSQVQSLEKEKRRVILVKERLHLFPVVGLRSNACNI